VNVRRSYEVRPFRPEDAPLASERLLTLAPEFVVTAPLLLHWLESSPARAAGKAWVAASGDAVVGWADASFRWEAAEPGIGTLWVGVDPAHRGRGLGARLSDAAESHLVERHAWKLQSHVSEGDEASLRFALGRGYSETRRERLWSLEVRRADLSELPELEARKSAEGFRVVPLGELRDRPRALHALFAAAEADVPADDATGELDFDDWRRETWENPGLDDEMSAVVMQSDEPVSFAWLVVDREGGRAEHEMTGTNPLYRGRGLARLAKLATIRWCAELGVRILLTGNDSANAPMLAINARLGYQPTLVRLELAKQLKAPR